MDDLDRKIREMKRRRDALRGRGRRRAAARRPETRDQKIARCRSQIKKIHDDVLPAMEKGGYGWRVANRSLEQNRAELRILLGVERPGDGNRRGAVEYQALRK